MLIKERRREPMHLIGKDSALLFLSIAAPWVLMLLAREALR